MTTTIAILLCKIFIVVPYDNYKYLMVVIGKKANF